MMSFTLLLAAAGLLAAGYALAGRRLRLMALSLLLAAAGLLVAGYALSRLRPANRASDWANWRTYGNFTSLRFAAVWLVLTTENVTLIVTHPVRCWRAWKRRNDPPPGRSPAMEIPRVRRDAAPAYDPRWAEHRHTPTTTDSDDREDDRR
jgi:hypothetical protein